MGDVDDNNVTEEPKTCKHFLADSGIENGRDSVFNFAMDTLDLNFWLQKMNFVFDRLKGAAKLKVASRFVFKIVEEGSCR